MPPARSRVKSHHGASGSPLMPNATRVAGQKAPAQPELPATCSTALQVVTALQVITASGSAVAPFLCSLRVWQDSPEEHHLCRRSISVLAGWDWWYHPYPASHRLPVIIPVLQPPCPPLPKFPSLWSPCASRRQHISSSNPNGINKGRIRAVSHPQRPGKGQVLSHVLLEGFFSRLVRTLAVSWRFLDAEGAGEGLPRCCGHQHPT